MTNKEYYENNILVSTIEELPKAQKKKILKELSITEEEFNTRINVVLYRYPSVCKIHVYYRPGSEHDPLIQRELNMISRLGELYGDFSMKRKKLPLWFCYVSQIIIEKNQIIKNSL